MCTGVLLLFELLQLLLSTHLGPGAVIAVIAEVAITCAITLTSAVHPRECRRSGRTRTSTATTCNGVGELRHPLEFHRAKVLANKKRVCAAEAKLQTPVP